MEITLKERLEKIRIRLMRHKPFFGYVIPKLTFTEDPDCPTAAIDARGNVFYSEDFLNKYNDGIIEGIICHELLHYVLRHHTRGADFKSQQVANIAQDLVINDILIHLEKMDFLPHIDTYDINKRCKSKTVKCFGTSKIGIFTIIDSSGVSTPIQVRGKPWEYVYDCLIDILEHDKQNKQNHKKSTSTGDTEDDDNNSPTTIQGDHGSHTDSEQQGSSNGESNNNSDDKSDDNFDNNPLGNSFDKHIWSDLSKEEREKIEQQVNDILAEAKTFDDKTNKRNPDDSDANSWMGRLLRENLQPQIDWRTHLRKSIQSCIPYDFTYSKPNKRSYSSGYYIPDTIKEQFEVTLAIDVSGSISDKEFSTFMAELKGILNSKPRIKVRTLFYSTEVDEKNDQIFTRSNLYNLPDKLSVISTTGGNRESCIAEYLHNLKNDKNKSALETMIYITDGYIEDNPVLYKSKNIIFVITPTGSDEIIKKIHKGTIIRLNNRQ